MPQLTPSDAAAVLRRAVAALSGRLSTDYGELVPDASAERTAALAAKLEAGAAGVGPDDLATLDSWIRLADSAVLHDDAAEARSRAELATRLRAVRAVVSPDDGLLTEDARDGR
jgi:hypothetical protein